MNKIPHILTALWVVVWVGAAMTATYKPVRAGCPECLTIQYFMIHQPATNPLERKLSEHRSFDSNGEDPIDEQYELTFHGVRQ